MRHLLIAVLTLLVLVPPAAAQRDRGEVVARHGDVELFAYDNGGGDLCIGFRSQESTVSTTCSGSVMERFEAHLLSHGTDAPERTFVGGAAPAKDGTTAVELEYADGDRSRANTIAGTAYKGRHRDRVVFFIAETTAAKPAPDEEPVLLRRFDAAGKLIGASSAGFQGGTIAGPATLLRRGGTRVEARATRSFAPSLLKIDRLERQVCISIEHRDGSGGGGSCAGSGPRYPRLELQTQRSCGHGTMLYGFTAPQVVSVEVTLGSGRRVRVPSQDLSSLGTAARAVAMIAPVGEAIRRGRALDAAGDEVERHDVGAAPSPRRCGRSGGHTSTFGFFSYDSTDSEDPAPPEGQQVAARGPGGAQLVVRDEIDEHLCVGVDELAADRHDCIVPSPDPYFPEFDVDVSDARTVAGGIVPAGAASVRLVLDGREKVTAAISDGGDYTGPYRGHLRFFLAEAPGRHRVTEIETLDAAGNLLSVVPGPGAEALPTRTFARGRGLRIFGARWSYRFKFPGEKLETSRGSCFGVAIGDEKPSHERCEFIGADRFLGRVTCAPRLGVMMGRLTKRYRGMRLTLAGGRTISSRAVRIPRRLGGGRLWVLTIPRSARVTRLRYLGQRPSPYGPRPPRGIPRPALAGRYDVAAPSRQCGYALPSPTF